MISLVGCFISADTVHISLPNNNSPVVCTGLEKHASIRAKINLPEVYTDLVYVPAIRKTLWNSLSFATTTVKESAVCAHQSLCLLIVAILYDESV